MTQFFFCTAACGREVGHDDKITSQAAIGNSVTLFRWLLRNYTVFHKKGTTYFRL